MNAMLEDCHVTLRGHGQETGYLARVERLEEKVGKFVNGDFAKLKTELLEAIKAQSDTIRKELDQKIEKLQEAQKAEMGKTIQWTKILSGFVAPVLLSVITAITVAYVLLRIGLK
jgi:hypothetical protein